MPSAYFLASPIEHTIPLSLLHIRNRVKMSDINNNIGDDQLHLDQAGGLLLSETASEMEQLNVMTNSNATAEVPDTKTSSLNPSETNPLSFSP